MSFNCCLCRSQIELKRLSGLPCTCLICMDCSIGELEGQIRRQYPGSGAPAEFPPLSRHRTATNFEVGETVMYLTKDGVYVEAVVEIIDITVQPPQYGIQLPGRDDLRFTEEHRLCGTHRRGAPQPPGYYGNGPSSPPFHHHHYQQQHLAVQCPCCRTPVSLPDLRLLVPQAVAAWEAERTSAWLRHNNIITCPRPDCGALIQRVFSGAASADGGGDSGGRGAATSTAYRRPSSTQQRRESAAAAVCKEQHRYRCGACQRDFCDACLSAPYHDGLTCRQAQAPDCLMCGGKVDEDRIEQLLPRAAAAAAAEAGGSGAVASHLQGESSSGDSVGRRKQVGSGSCGGGSVGVAAADASLAAATAVVQQASRAELLLAMKNKLDVDTVWCLERRDLEKAFLHWGYRTCSSPECATRLRGMCGRPLACGHWCCGIRGEGEGARSASTSASESEPESQTHSHPRCVECGFRPDSHGISAIPSAAAGAATAPAAAAALMKDCCFCWEPLSSGPCIEMACGPRHMCHLHCARARLDAGYPGPHISFTHLYCPLCRSGDGGGGGGRSALATGTEAAGGLSPGGPSIVQTALAPVHLDHPTLRSHLAVHLALRAEVVAAARARIKMDSVLRSDPELQPGGRYDGRPADYGLERLTFYKCSKCAKVYYGGQRACGVAADAAAASEQQQQQGGNGAAAAAAHGGGGGGGGGGSSQAALVCGECCARSAGTNCPRHGTSYIEWKCRYCCSLASWFCYGTTHMCDPCHKAAAYGLLPRPAVIGNGDTCKDPKCRLEGIPHPPPGREACLGCGMCRAGL